MNSSDIIKYTKIGFDGNQYIETQKNQILERISKFGTGRLYLEVGGKLMYDTHAARVLPGFLPESKKNIFYDLRNQIEILFCVNASDILSNRQLSNEDIDYKDYVLTMLRQIEQGVGTRPHLVINKIDVQNMVDMVITFERFFQKQGYKVRERYKINGYPNNVQSILSEDGFGNDDHIPLNKNLVIVTGAASNSGKMSTCLGQIYLDKQIGIDSGYAKYETFPIWNIDINHPINLAYEAATADIGDFNCMDTYHKKAYGTDSVNYNRDVEGFQIVMGISKNIIDKHNYMHNYQSPTDMGISNAGFAITNDEIVSIASLQEIQRRKKWYQEMIDRKEGDAQWIDRCNELEKKCMEYIDYKSYNINIKL